jgi:hypothetical protein
MTMDPHQPAAPVPISTAPAEATSPGPRPTPVVAVTPRARSGRVLNLLLIGAAILAIGGVAFAIGRSTAPVGAFQRAGTLPDGTAIRPNGSFAPGAGGPGGAFALGGGLSIDGTVKAVDADSLTLTLDSGEEVTFTLDSATTYREATDAAASDVSVGDEVSVKVAGNGRLQTGAGAGGQAPDLTAEDVTVAR